MLNSAIVIKLKQRINKLDSQDYDNIECWQAIEAFNKLMQEISSLNESIDTIQPER